MNTPINPGEFNVELTIRLKTAGPYTVRLSGRRAIAAGLISVVIAAMPVTSILDDLPAPTEESTASKV